MRLQARLSISPVLIIVLSAALPTLAAPLKICDLITRQEAAAIAGVAVGPGDEQSVSKGMGMCMFSASGTGGQTVSVGVMEKEGLMGASAATVFKVTTGHPEKGVTNESIPGLGEAAVLATSAHDNSLNILYHDKIVSVDATDAKNPGLKTALIEAAKRVLAKL